MRLKNVPGADQKMIQDPFTIQTDGKNGSDFCGTWHERFGNSHPIHVEIGMGKGQFLTGLAKAYPQVNYIGVEKYSSVLVRAIPKRAELELTNLLFLRMDAEKIAEFFAPGEIERIYLNFSDPWPKDRHAKRRLTHADYLKKYRALLAPGGSLEFKTDNPDLFDFSREQLELEGWAIIFATRDYYHAPENAVDFADTRSGNGSVSKNSGMTEYEEKFYRQGVPICKITAKPNR